MRLWERVEARIAEATGDPFTLRERIEVGGGCINRAWRVGDGRRRYFVKVNDAGLLDMFEAEAEGLQAIAATATVRVPRPVGSGEAEGSAFLVLEFLALGGGGGAETLGRRLAAMHRSTAPRFGWHRDNTLGITPQPNGWSPDWPTFLSERRIAHQLRLAADRPEAPRLLGLGEALLERMGDLFAGYAPLPSLLHGDLWGGNWSQTTSGEPAIFDPAVYYGDREADIAMTELFGGFDPRFYAAYREAWPLDGGYEVRRDLYNLYHVLNHYHLFGGGYGAQAVRLMERLLGELR